MQNVVIVESPTKARTLSKFLGKNYKIEASMGHIRDLPKAEIGVDEETFEPKYIIPRDKKKKVNELKKMMEGADVLYLATDPDREGEAIAWHLAQIMTMENRKLKVGAENGGLKVDKKINSQSSTLKKPSSIIGHLPSIRRVEFHEITKNAIMEAFEHPREINLQLVDAQQARRVLDRLVGYKLSPVLWKKIKRGLSAGRVQSVALRLIVEREREIEAFKANEYWSIEVLLDSKESEGSKESKVFTAQLTEINREKAVINNSDEAEKIVGNLKQSAYSVRAITKKEVKRSPAPPFTTSTLQQTSGNKLGMSAKKTMMIAQNLYEQGYITYMRTDSVNLSTLALGMARDYISANLGAEYLPAQARFYKAKSKNAQEAHEAIRPTDVNLNSEKLKGDNFTRDHKRLYDLIFKRTVASQVNDAVFDQTSVDVIAIPRSGEAIPVSSEIASPAARNDASAISLRDDEYNLRATGSQLKFPGWLKVYGIDKEEEEEEKVEGEEKNKAEDQKIPNLTEGEALEQKEIKPLQHFTQPPPRFTEASLVKKLEELGIGRPSTYAPILSTIQDRYYVEKTERKFNPTSLGMTVNDFLMKHFPELFDYQFTAQMEDSLDDISRGEKEWKETVATYFKPLSAKLGTIEETAERVVLEVETVDKNCPKCGKQLIVRTGKFGKFLACSGFPDCKHTERIEQILDVKCPDDGGDVVVRKTKRGKTFFGCKNYPNCKYASWTKPKDPAIANA